MPKGSLLCLAVLALAPAVGLCAEGPVAVDRDAAVRAMLERSRLLQDIHFSIPVALYERYLRETTRDEGLFPAPVAMIAGEGAYRLNVPADRLPTLEATVRLHVFRPDECRSIPVLSSALVWEKVTVNGKPASLANSAGWLRLTPEKPGEHVISAEVSFGESISGGFSMAIPRTVRTLLWFDSPGAWEVTVPNDSRRLRGDEQKGTHGFLSLTPRDKLEFTHRRPAAETQRPPRYELRGDVVWNLDAAGQQVTAALRVAIVGGLADSIDLVLPASADRIAVTGPDVREVRVAAGAAQVFLRGRIAEQTRLSVSYELPGARTGLRKFGGLTVRDGHWSGGSFVVTNTAGGSEAVPESVSGLREIALLDIPESASAIMPGPAVLAYEIASRQWSAEVDVVSLGEFALRESIADTAFYEMVFRDDGSVMCRASYEIRNRNKQFLRLDLPPGARVVLARVNEQSRPVSPVPGEKDAYLLPLVRSKASVKGLVSFPVDIVILYRTDPLKRRGEAELRLPRVDLPIAYARCEAYMPRGLARVRWSGALERVDRYASETAVSSLGYGRGEAAEKERAAMVPVAEDGARAGGGVGGVPVLGDMPVMGHLFRANLKESLARNYYRAGQEFYDKSDFANAAAAFEEVRKLAPGSIEAANAERFYSNIKLLGGQAAPASRAEKAAAAQVRQEITAPNVALSQFQMAFLEKGQLLLRQGNLEEARSQFEAAKVLSPELVARGEQSKEQFALLREATEQLAQAGEEKKQKVSELRKELEQLKESGRYEEALETVARFRRSGAAKNGAELGVDVEALALNVQKRLLVQQQELHQQTQEAPVLKPRTVAVHGAAAGSGAAGAIQPPAGQAGSFQFKPTGQGVPDVASATLRTVEVIGIAGGGRYVGEAATSGVVRGEAGGATFFGVGGAAEKIVYVVDGSGSMADSIAYVKHELKRSIANLRPNQQFHVVVARSGAPAEMPPGRPVPATEANKQMACAFIDGLVPLGQTDPAGALTRAFELKPDAAYLLSDGEMNKSVVGLVDRLNRDRRVALNTLGFLYTGGEAVLEDLARRNRGMYKYVGEDDLEVARGPGRAPATLPGPRVTDGRETQYEGRAARRPDSARRQGGEAGRPQVMLESTVAEVPGTRDDIGIDVEESAVPFRQVHRYPSPAEWDEQTHRRSQAAAEAGAESAAAAVTRRKLAARGIVDENVGGFMNPASWSLSLDMPDRPLGEVLERIAAGARGGQHEVDIVIDRKGIADAGVDLNGRISVRADDVSLGQALAMVLGDRLGYGIRADGTVIVTSRGRMGQEPAARDHLVQDLEDRVPDFDRTVPRFNLAGALAHVDRREQVTTTTFKPYDGPVARSYNVRSVAGDRAEGGKNVERMVRELFREEDQVKRLEGAPPPPLAMPIQTELREGDNLVVTANAAQHEQIEGLLRQLEAARGPQVEMGAKIAMQRATGTNEFLQDGGWGYAADSATKALPAQAAPLRRQDEESQGLAIRRWFDNRASVEDADRLVSDPHFQKFIAENYTWQRPGVTFLPRHAEAIDADSDGYLNDLSRKLQFNLGQKVPVNSINLSVDSAAANALGIAFQTGNNDLNFAVIDEAQFRTLMELQGPPQPAAPGDGNQRGQDTIVGTQVLLANGMVGNLEFAGDRRNTLDINANGIVLPHEKYVLINNGDYLTAVRAGEMQYWKEKASSIQFVEAPQTIDVPRVGQLVRFEKTLVKPTDQLVIRATYTWKGAAQ